VHERRTGDHAGALSAEGVIETGGHVMTDNAADDAAAAPGDKLELQSRLCSLITSIQHQRKNEEKNR
jgi:hypothetical protein